MNPISFITNNAALYLIIKITVTPTTAQEHTHTNTPNTNCLVYFFRDRYHAVVYR